MKKVKVVFLIIMIFSVGFFSAEYFSFGSVVTADDLSMDEQELTVRAIEKVMPATVNITVYDYEEVLVINAETNVQELLKEKAAISSGTGFIISPDGLIMTNRHVIDPVSDSREYKIILDSGKQYYAQFIDEDPINDLAVLKIYDKDLPYVEIGDSDELGIGSTVIAIGNVLGRYQNSATKGIVSGLGRYLMTTDGVSGRQESLYNVIQTDADINLGNSGGPLINLKGEVVGVNVAIDEGGNGIGFAIASNDAEPVIRTIKESGKIIRPKLGLRYMMLDPIIAEQNDLLRDEGAWVHAEDGQAAVVAEGPADLAGIEEGDIIFEVNAIKIEGKNNLLSVLQKFKPGDKLGFKIQRGDEIIIKIAELGEF
jgi:S1-C subfamily serine protease